MIGKIFYNVIVFGTIISICIFPLLIFLSKNKYKYNFKSIYKMLAIILLALFIPINTINFSNIKDIFQRENIDNEIVVLEKPQIKFETEGMVIEVDNSINVKNDTCFNISKVLPYVWVVGFSVMLLYNLLFYIIFCVKAEKNYKENKNLTIDKIMDKLCEELEMKQVEYIISKNISTPMTIGLFKKRIILSDEVLEEKQYEIILKHELYHIKNKDIEYKFLLLILNCIYWFNPIIYVFANQFDEILELNCDEAVLKNQSQIYRIEYAKTLLSQIEQNRNEQYKFSINFANRRKNIMHRFSNIVKKNKEQSIIKIATVTAILLITSILLIVLIPNINFATIPENIVETVNTPKEKITDIGNEETKLEEEQVVNDTEEDNTKTELTENMAEEKLNKPEKIAEENKEVKDAKEENTKTSNTEISFATPVNGTITSRYGKRNNGMHTGLDIAAPEGTPIYSCADGVVKYSGYHGSYGNLVVIEHNEELQTYYAKCSKLLVKEGDTVSKGDIIAEVGSTGNSTGPHLHLEVRINKITVNPQIYVY